MLIIARAEDDRLWHVEVRAKDVQGRAQFLEGLVSAEKLLEPSFHAGDRIARSQHEQIGEMKVAKEFAEIQLVFGLDVLILAVARIGNRADAAAGENLLAGAEIDGVANASNVTAHAVGVAAEDCRVLNPRPGQAGYSDTPRLLEVGVQSLGASGPASHSFRVVGEELGATDGHPGQTLTLQTVPILPRRAGEQLEVQDHNGVYQPWTEVPDFGGSGPDDPHYVLDEVSGAVEFGPRIRSPRGEERQYGRTPPAGRKVRFSSYRTGGGTVGNVGARTLSQLKSSIPYVQWVTNYLPATGGSNTEDLEHAKWRAPRLLRTRERAVTAEDFEVLARDASSGVARARCLPVRGSGGGQDGLAAAPGTVRLQIVPALPTEARPVSLELVQLSTRVRSEVQSFLDERRLLALDPRVNLEAVRTHLASIPLICAGGPQAE